MRDAHGGALFPQRVVGRYALYGEIASGGMATVHFGRLLGPVGFSRTVAIKRLHPQFAKDPEFVSMFLDEARVAARIQHPNVVSTLDVVALQGELFLVMEYVQGETLSRILKLARARNEPIAPRIVGAIATNVLFGLHAAHEAKSERGEPLGIVHRDVSPQNVLVGTDGVSRVLDFGVAKAAGRIQVTREGQVKGKLAYMPPEQLSGGEIDRRADVYAAAVLVWESLTNRRLFDGDNPNVVLARVLTAKVVAPSTYNSMLPAGVDEVVLRGLSRNPDVRFATAHEMAVALEDSLGIETPRRVAEFLHRCAHDALAAKAALVKEIEAVDTDTAVKMMMRAGELESASDLHERYPSAAPGSRSSAAFLATFTAPGESAVAGASSSSSSSSSSLPVGLDRGDGSGLSKVSSVALSLREGLQADPSAPGNAHKTRNPAVALVGVCALALLTVVLWWSASSSKTTIAASPSGSVIPSAATRDAPARIAAPDAAVPAASSATIDPASSASVAPSAAVAKPAPSATLSKPLPRAPTVQTRPPPKPPAGNCDPPYTLDATGKRRLKSWCL